MGWKAILLRKSVSSANESLRPTQADCINYRKFIFKVEKKCATKNHMRASSSDFFIRKSEHLSVEEIEKRGKEMKLRIFCVAAAIKMGSCILIVIRREKTYVFAFFWHEIVE
jgi:hypothetical protein